MDDRFSFERKVCEKFGLRAIPKGWDALEVYIQARAHGANFRNVVENMLIAQAAGAISEPPEAA